MTDDDVLTSSSMTSLWIDADPSGLYQTGLDCDDDLAILIAIALHRRQIINLSGLSICGGNAPLRHTWNNANTLWKYINGYDRTGIQHPIKGYGWNSMQVGVKPLQYYNMLFPDVDDSDDAATAILEAADEQYNAKRPMTILSLGPPTNIAKAIQQRPSTMNNNNIGHIYLMGGELTNQQLDLNFRSDRASARIVIDADIPKTILPIQTCGQVVITDEWISSLNCDHHQHQDSSSDDKILAVCAYLSKMKQQIRLMPRFVNKAVKDRMVLEEGGEGTTSRSYVWKPSPNLDKGFIPWDIIALLAISHPNEFNEWKYHRVSLPNCSSGEPCDGTMKVLEDLPDDYFDNDNNNGVKKRSWGGIVRVPHEVRNETKLLEIMLDLISDIEVPSSSPLFHEQQQWGFGNAFSGFSIATAMFVICCIKLCFRLLLPGYILRYPNKI